MWRCFVPALLIAALASCGSGDTLPKQRSAGDSADRAALAAFSLASDDFRDGRPIPAVHACDGADLSPALSWDEPPTGTKSLALVMDDPDAPGGTFRHWAAYDIPPTTRSIARGTPVGKQAVNDFGKSGYAGPCSPKGHGPHRYRFRLYAVNVGGLSVPAGATVEQVEAEARRRQLGLAQITGTYERK